MAILGSGLVSAQKNVEVKASYGTSSLYGMAESITGNVFNALNILDPNRQVVTYSSAGVFALEVMLHSDDSKWKYGFRLQLRNGKR